MKSKKRNRKHMKARIRPQYTPVIQRAIDEDIAAQANEKGNAIVQNMIRQAALELEAAMIWAVREVSGERNPKSRWGKKRLKRLYMVAGSAVQTLLDRYEMPDDTKFVCLYELEKMGIDLKAWEKENNNPIRVHVD